MRSITILDADYKKRIKELGVCYWNSQIKAAVKVNSEMLHFYWSLGKDIVDMKADSRWGKRFFEIMSKVLKESNSEPEKCEQFP